MSYRDKTAFPIPYALPQSVRSVILGALSGSIAVFNHGSACSGFMSGADRVAIYCHCSRCRRQHNTVDSERAIISAYCYCQCSSEPQKSLLKTFTFIQIGHRHTCAALLIISTKIIRFNFLKHMANPKFNIIFAGKKLSKLF